jgi:lipoate-protein ligase A
MDKYNIGQLLRAKEDLQLEGCFGKTKAIKKGTKIYIGADGFAHYLDGTMQPLKEKAEGFSVEGITDWLYEWLSGGFPLDDFLEDYEISEKEFKEKIADALEELGMWDNTGNRS